MHWIGQKKIFAMTSYEKIVLNSIYGIDSDKIVIWPAGVGDEAFTSPNLKNVREIFLKIADKNYGSSHFSVGKINVKSVSELEI